MTQSPPTTAPGPVRGSCQGAEPVRGWERLRAAVGTARRVLATRWDILLVIAVGGAIGSLARRGVAEIMPTTVEGFPWGTFVVNVTGCLVIGFLMVLIMDAGSPSRYLRPFLGTGVLGGYTTFSTYMLEARDLLIARQPGLAWVYLAGSLAVGLAAVWLGVAVGRTLLTLRRQRPPRDEAQPDPDLTRAETSIMDRPTERSAV